eukprot:scaffold100793_cov63-Phaeocystis_antarctica.AAC.2
MGMSMGMGMTHLHEPRRAVEALAGGLALGALVAEEEVHPRPVHLARQLNQRRHRRARPDAHAKGALRRDRSVGELDDAALDEPSDRRVVLHDARGPAVLEDERGSTRAQSEHGATVGGGRTREVGARAPESLRSWRMNQDECAYEGFDVSSSRM